jgi:hypothetical protein
MPFLPLGHEIGGIVWLMLGIAGTVVAAALASRWLPIGQGWASMGLALMRYAGMPTFVARLVVGNVNALLLAVLTAFAWAHVSGHQRTAGVLLGITVAVKAWPVALTVLLFRERRWRELVWAGGVVAVVGAVTLIWLGPGVVSPMVAALQTSIPAEPGNVIWTRWLRVEFGVPAWIGPLLAIVLLALPLRGALGIAAGLVAGVSLITNIWPHYNTTFALAAVLAIAGGAAAYVASSSRVVRRSKAAA